MSESLKCYIHFLKDRSHCLRIQMLNVDSHWKLKLPISRNCFAVNHSKEKTFKTDTDELKFNTENPTSQNSTETSLRTLKNSFS